MKKALVSLAVLVCLVALPLAAQGPRTGRGGRHEHARMNQRVYNDSARLASLLHDTQQGRANPDRATWARVVNEATVLADRIYANAPNGEARRNARELRMHVRAMRQAAMRGNAGEARDHARLAFPYTTGLMDWSSPNSGPMHH